MTLDIFTEDLEPNQQEIIHFLNDQFLQFPGISFKIRFKIPFYYYRTWVCYLNPRKHDKVELVFINGQELSNHHGLLEKRARKKVSGILIDSLESLPIDSIMESFSEALILEEENFKTKKK